MKILLLNVHSGLNLGDHGIMHSTLQTLRERFPGAEITVAANDPASWRAPADPLRAFEPFAVLGSFTRWVYRLEDARWRRRLGAMAGHALLLACAGTAYRLFRGRLRWGSREQRRLLDAYYDADVVLSCGGGNFYADRPLSPFLIWALLALAFAIVLGKRVVMLPQSFGPIPGRAQRALMRWVLDHAEVVMVREPWSARFVADQLCVRTPLAEQPDLAFGLAGAAHSARPARGAPQVGVTILDRAAQLRSFGAQQTYEDALCGLLARLAAERGAEIHLFCQCYGPSIDQDDRLATARLHDRLVRAGVPAVRRPDLHSAADALEAYGEMDLMVGTRMHTAIFALCRAAPILLIGYQPKGCNVMATVGLERYCQEIARLDPARLYDSAIELLDRRAEVQAAILQQQDGLRERAAGWTRYLA